jgi:hypothetical protein
MCRSMPAGELIHPWQSKASGESRAAAHAAILIGRSSVVLPDVQRDDQRCYDRKSDHPAVERGYRLCADCKFPGGAQPQEYRRCPLIVRVPIRKDRDAQLATQEWTCVRGGAGFNDRGWCKTGCAHGLIACVRRGALLLSVNPQPGIGGAVYARCSKCFNGVQRKSGIGRGVEKYHRYRAANLTIGIDTAVSPEYRTHEPL